jgi:FkbM family methyltransferase
MMGVGWTWLPVAVMFGGVPLVDALVRPNLLHRSTQEIVDLEQRLTFRVVTWLWVPVHVALVIWAVHTASSWPIGWTLGGLWLSVAVIGGAIGITFAHELVHRSSWAIERVRLRRRGRSVWSLSNTMLRYAATLVFLYGAVNWMWGTRGLAFFVLQGMGAFLLLEAINYVEHYGLQRHEESPGKYERVAARHSWDSSHRVSNWLLINLARHSDHHLVASRRYPALSTRDQAPQLPAGYGTMLLLALVPPLWRRVMDARVVAARTGVVVAAVLGLLLGSACGRVGPLSAVSPISPAAFVENLTTLRPVVLRDEVETASYLEAFPLSAYRLSPSEGVGHFYLDTTDDVIKAVLEEGGAWEPEIRDLLRQHIRPGTAVLDIGAHIGTHTVTMARRVGSQGHVFAFEPQKKLFRELQMNMRANQIGNVTPLRFALGEGDPHVVEMEPDTGGNEGGLAVGRGGDHVELRTVDSFRFTNVSLIKIDVEGYEDHVLRGATRTITSQRPVLIIEILGGTDYAEATLEQRAAIDRTQARIRRLGYTVTRVSMHDYLGVPLPGADSAPGGSRNGSIGIAR